MQTRRKGRKPVKPKYTGPLILGSDEVSKDFSSYLNNPTRKYDYIELVLSEQETSSKALQLKQLRYTLNSEQQLLNNIIQNKRISIKQGKQWQNGLKKLQEATNQLNAMDLENKKLTKAQLYQAKQIFDAYNYATRQIFTEMFVQDSSFNKRYTNQSRLNKSEQEALYRLIQTVNKTGEAVLGELFRSSDIEKALGIYEGPKSQHYYKRQHEERHERYSALRGDRVDYGEIFKIQNQNVKLGNPYVSEEEINKQWERARAKTQSTDYDALQAQVALFWRVRDYYEEAGQKWEDYKRQQETYLQNQLACFWNARDYYEITGNNESYMDPYMMKSLQTQVQDKIMKDALVKNLLGVGSQVLDAQNILIYSTHLVVDQISSGFKYLQDTFDDIFDFPVRQVIQVLGLATECVGMTGTTFQIQIDSFFKMSSTAISKGGIKKSGNKEKDIDNEAMNSVRTVFEQMMDVAVALLNILSQGVQLIQGVVNMGINSFITIFSAILKILKKIFQTSMVIDQIMNILSLGMSIFILPAVLLFGDKLFKQVLSFLEWLNDKNGGLALLEFVDLYGILQMPILELIEKVIAYTPNIVIQIKNALPLFAKMIMELIPVFMNFFKQLLSDGGSNIQSIIELCQIGVNLAEKLLEDGILSLFLNAGQQGMGFIAQNKDNLFKPIELIWRAIDTQYRLINACSNHMVRICMQIGAGIGAFLGFISNLLITVGGLSGLGLLIQAFGPKIAQIGALESALNKTGLSMILGGGFSGAQIGGILATKYFSFKSYQEGGYIPATPGGLLIRVAEKETEYIIPESKTYMIRGHNNLILEINGDVYGINKSTDIMNVIDEVSNRSRFR